MSSALFEDPEFPCTGTSIADGGDQKVAGLDRVVQWLRPRQICAEPQLFSANGPQADQLRQGEISNRPLMCAFALLAQRRELIENMFVDANSDAAEASKYNLRLFKDGEPCVVTIDDRLPCDKNGQIVFARCADKNVFWASLLEKAFAKMHSNCYSNIVSGSIPDILVKLVGGAGFQFKTSDKLARERLLNSLADSNKQPCILGLTSYSSIKTSEGMHIHDTCLVRGHTYPVIGIHSAEGEQFLELSNPWMLFKDDHPWMETLKTRKQKFSSGFERKDTFLITLDEALSLFDTVDGVKLMSNWQSTRCTGVWSPNQTNPFSLQDGEPISCPQYLLYVEEETDIVVVLTRVQTKKMDLQAHFSTAIGFVVVRLDGRRTRRGKRLRNMDRVTFFNTKREFARTIHWKHTRDTEQKIESCSPGSYMIIPFPNTPSDEEFSLRVFARSSPIELKPMPSVEDMYTQRTVYGKWEIGSTAGGCVNSSHWTKNRQFRFEITAPETIPSVEVRVALVRDDVEDDISGTCAGFYFLRPRNSQPDAPQLVSKFIIGKSPFLNNRVVQLVASVQCNRRYIIVPCTFDRDVEGSFSLHISHRKDLFPEAVPHLEPHGLEYNRWIMPLRWSVSDRTAGGSSRSTFLQNPKLRITLESDADFDVLLCQFRRPLVSTGFHLLDRNMKRVVAKTTKWIKSSVLQYSFSLGKGEYVVVPSAYQSGVEREFEVSVVSRSKSVKVSRIVGGGEQGSR